MQLDPLGCFSGAPFSQPIPVGQEVDGYQRVDIHRKYRDGDKKDQWIMQKDGTDRRKVYQSMKRMDTGDLFVPDSPQVVATKCIMLTIYSPFTAALHVGMRGINLLVNIFLGIGEIAEPLWKANLIEVTIKTVDLLQTVAFGVARIAIVPLFKIAMLFVSLYGVLSPFQAREWYASLEKIFQEGASYRDGALIDAQGEIQWMPPRKNGFPVLFEAACFQPRGNVQDPDVALCAPESS